MSLNVLVTAGSRRVPLVRAFQRAVAQHRGGSVIVTDVNPLSPAVHAANRAYHVPLATEPELHRHDPGDRAGRATSRWSCRPSTTNWSCSAPSATGSPRTASASRCRRRRPRRCATTNTPPAGSCSTAASPRRRRGYLASCRRRRRSRCSSSRAAGGAASAPIRPHRPANSTSSSTTSPTRSSRRISTALSSPSTCCATSRGQPLSIVPRRRDVIRAGVTDRGRTVNDPTLIRVAQRVRGGPAVRRRRQHPVPRRRRASGGVRDQPALLGRHSADHSGRGRPAAHAGRSGGRAARAAGDRTVPRRPVDDQLREPRCSSTARASAWPAYRPGAVEEVA